MPLATVGKGQGKRHPFFVAGGQGHGLLTSPGLLARGSRTASRTWGACGPWGLAPSLPVGEAALALGSSAA